MMGVFDERAGPTVFVISGDHDRTDMLCNRLTAAGLSAQAADFTRSSDVMLFDLSTCNPALLREMIYNLEEITGDRPLLVGLGPQTTNQELTDQLDLVLSSDEALALAPTRFRFAQRLPARRAEADLRERSFSRYGVKPRTDQRSNTGTVLYVGDAASLFPSMQKALAVHDRQLSAAFSAYTAYDYLHDARFDAIVLDATCANVRPDSFCDMINRSPSLTDLPLLALIDPDRPLTHEIVQRATDLMSIHADPALIAAQLVHLAQFHEPGSHQFISTDGVITDSQTGLFSRKFFLEHLSLQIEWAHRRKQSLSLLLIDVIAEEQDQAGALSHAANMVRSLSRAQDVPGRLADGQIAISLPCSDEVEAATAARRICDVLDATAFESGAGSQMRQALVSHAVASLKPGMNTDDLFNAARDQKIRGRGYAA